MNARTRAVQTPGAPAAETHDNEVQDVAVETQESAASAADQVIAAEETVVVSKATLEALLARVESLERAPAQAAARRANPEADLPDADKIDLATLKTPVLTKQGWLVPEKFGANPAAKAL